MSNRYNPGYHPLDDLKARLREETRRLNEEAKKVADSVDAEYYAARANEDKLTQEIDQVKAQALALNDASVREAVLEREVDADRQLYQSVLQRMNEINVDSEVPTSNVSVADSAAPPRHPLGPSILLLLAFAGGGAAFLGIALAFFLESMDDSLKTYEEVPRYLGLPSLGIVPDFMNQNGSTYLAGRYPSYKGRRRDLGPSGNGYGTGMTKDAGAADASHPGKFRALGNPAVAYRAAETAVTNDNWVSKELVVTYREFSSAAETFRTIRSAIMFSRAGGAPRVILTTSAVAGEGKTITAANIASAFAHTGNRTLIIDADLRRGRVHEILEVEPGQGLSEVLVRLRKLEDLIVPTKVSGLCLLPAGSVPPNPSELLASPEMRALIKRTGELFDYVVIDSAPVMPVSDSLGLATMVDGVMVVAGGRTSRRLVRESCARLTHVGGPILGIVLNRVDVKANSYYHYDHYSHYYFEKQNKEAPEDGEITDQG
jgi:capsular exopolysaccharide synthesis family protein